MTKKVIKIKSNKTDNEYSVILSYDDNGKLIDALCDCRFSSLFPNNFKNGDNICRHIKQALKKEIQK